MAQRECDRFSRSLAGGLSRRTLAGLTGLAGLGLAGWFAEPDASDARKKKKRKKKKEKTSGGPGTLTCTPDSAATTCSGRCGSVANICGKQISCGACGCTAISNVGTLQIAIDGTPAGGTLRLCGQHIILNQTITLRRDITIVGAGIGTTIIDGNNAVRPFIIDACVAVALSGLSIVNGAPAGLQNSGGGVSNQGTLIMAQVEIRDCRGQGGGAISTSGRLALGEGVRIHNNEAHSGGGIEIYGATAEAVIGSNCAIYNNAAKHAGGLAVINGATATLMANSAIFGNTASVNGGGIHIYLGTLIMMGNSTVGGYEDERANEAGNAGGGVLLERGTMTMEAGSYIVRNVGKYGGGIYVSNYDNTVLTVKSGSAVVRNEGDVVGGGGIYSNGVAVIENGAHVCDNMPANSQCAGGITGACPQPANGICGIPERSIRHAAHPEPGKSSRRQR